MEQNTNLVEFSSDRTYAVGTVLLFGGINEVTTATIVNDTRLAGVVSLTIGENMVAIAMSGRTVCRVVGRVKKGDLLTTANTPGCAVKALDPKLGSIIGKALQDKDFGEAGLIEIVVLR